MQCTVGFGLEEGCVDVIEQLNWISGTHARNAKAKCKFQKMEDDEICSRVKSSCQVERETEREKVPTRIGCDGLDALPPSCCLPVKQVAR